MTGSCHEVGAPLSHELLATPAQFAVTDMPAGTIADEEKQAY